MTQADQAEQASVVAQVAQAQELAEVDEATAEALARIVGEEFGIEMITPWGDRWVWVNVDAEVAQETYKMLGMPVTHTYVGAEAAPRRNGEAGALGGELGAE